ncbi:MAG: hypothetical protein SH868_16520, partial [Bythopirellula sp.]|nr:hypothetical protein [Bythopirellula sp.]
VGSSNKGKMVLPRRYLLGGGTAMLFNYTGDILMTRLTKSEYRSPSGAVSKAEKAVVTIRSPMVAIKMPHKAKKLLE